MWLRGATVARLTPDQKAACSNHVGVIKLFCFPTPSKLLKGGGPTKNIYLACLRLQKSFASNEDWTHDLWFTRPTLCHWAIEAPAEWLPLTVQQNCVGDTRIWTMDLSDCSRLLYHWAISPRLQLEERFAQGHEPWDMDSVIFNFWSNTASVV